MDLKGRLLANRYEILEKNRQWRNGNSIQGKMSCIK